MRASQISLGPSPPAEKKMARSEDLHEGSSHEPQQTTVLEVSIHCRGCAEKVKKLLHKIDGVLAVRVDGEEGRVTVFGAADPEVLVRALSGKGKRVQVLSSQPEGPQRLGFHLQKVRLERRGARGEEELPAATPRRSAFDVARLRDLVAHAVAGKGSRYVRLSKVDDEGGSGDAIAAEGMEATARGSYTGLSPSPLRSPGPPGSPAVAAVKNLWRQLTATATVT